MQKAIVTGGAGFIGSNLVDKLINDGIEVIILDKTRAGLIDELKAHLMDWDVKNKFCIFEHIYFARPDTIFDDKLVYSVRKRIGQELAIESAVECDMIVPVPDSGVPSALGYAQETVKFAEDGTPIGTEMGRLYENMEVDSSAMQVYLERNRKVLEEVLDPTDFQDLESDCDVRVDGKKYNILIKLKEEEDD